MFNYKCLLCSLIFTLVTAITPMLGTFMCFQTLYACWFLVTLVTVICYSFMYCIFMFGDITFNCGSIITQITFKGHCFIFWLCLVIFHCRLKFLAHWTLDYTKYYIDKSIAPCMPDASYGSHYPGLEKGPLYIIINF